MSNEDKMLNKIEADLIGHIMSNAGYIIYLEQCDSKNDYWNVVIHGIER